jgi:hypothetical protein
LASARRLIAVLLVAALAALGLVAGARADGDPASDVLYSGRVFFPYSTTVSKSAQASLLDTVAAAERAGYPIRVALIGGPVDLGAVTALWQKPRRYASFLSLELSFVYKGALLIVMPSGLGFAHYKHETGGEYAVLAKVSSAPGHDGLATTAERAVRVLAAHAGHPLGATGGGSGSSGANVALAGGVALAVLVLGGVAVFVVRRRGLGGGRS